MQQATFTFGDIRKRVRRQIGDDFAGRVDDSDIVRWINDAQREIVLANNLLQVSATIPLEGGINSYPVPNNVLVLHSIDYMGRPIRGLSYKEFKELFRDGEGRVKGQPTTFTIWAGRIRLYPYPDTGATNPGEIVVDYTRLPTEMTGTDVEQVLDLPITYQNRVLEYCLAQAAEMDENTEAYALKMQEFQSGVANTKDETDWTQRDVYPGIGISPDDTDMINGWMLF